MELEISDQDIESIENLLLPEGAHFQEDARNVIRCWHSTDISACPGSGKTTVLLAKLKLLSDRMPFEKGAGICVLSHTNVAVEEIKKRLSSYADKLFSYPNYIGTIQSFVDKFVTMPYLRNISGRNVQVVDNHTYAQHMLDRMQNIKKYNALDYLIKNRFKTGGQFNNLLEYIQELYIRDDGALCVGKQKNALALGGKPSTKQYKDLIIDLLKYEGIIRYKDAYLYANQAVSVLSETYQDLFSLRFQYVFIDEYQDCDIIQRQVISVIFNPQKCTLIKIGDPDQAIYNSSKVKVSDWVPQDGFLPIQTSCRYSQEIADVICKLKKSDETIITSVGNTGLKPILLVFDPDKIDRVISEFIGVLESHGLYDNKAIYKAIGAIRNKDSPGLKIGSYWTEFDSSVKNQAKHKYWKLIDDIATNLLEGNLYKVEYTVREILCCIFHYIKIKSPSSGREYSVYTIRRKLTNEYREEYSQWIYELSRIQNFDRENIDSLMRQNINKILKVKNPDIDDFFALLPEAFLDENAAGNQVQKSEKNIYIDPIRGRRIEFDTIHGVKGETHDATLYLETDRQGSSDLNRILPYFGVGKCGDSELFEYSRKLAYVGMSRAKKLLCVAMQAKTYEKSQEVFKDDWEIIDLRK